MRADELFPVIDTKDPQAFAAHLAEDATLRFGNAEPLVGRAAVVAALTQFFATFEWLRHELVNQWDVGAETVAETQVSYGRLDGSVVTVPAVSIWRNRDDGLIEDYRIFVDLAPLFTP